MTMTIASPSSSRHLNTSFATWNILADGLSNGEFVSANGDRALNWAQRGEGILQTLHEMLLEKNVSIVATQENDHYFSLLNKLQEHHPHIRGVFCVSNLKELSNAEEYYARRNCLSEELPSKPTKPTSIKEKQQYAQDLYTCHQRQKQTHPHIPSFEDECVPPHFAKRRLLDVGVNVHSHASTDAYWCPDGIGLYYDSTKMKLLRVHGDYEIICDNVYEYTEKQCIIEFVHLRTHTRFLVAVAHLKSGEQAKAETTRVAQLTSLMYSVKHTLLNDSDRNGTLVPVLLMDSNTNRAYQRAIDKENPSIPNRNVSTVLHDFQYYDVVDESVECVKMRHAQGGQSAKFGTLMVDSIDKIVVPKAYREAFCVNELSLNTFQRITQYTQKVLSKIRHCPDKRNALKSFVIRNSFGDSMQDNLARVADIDTDSCNCILGMNNGEICGVLTELYPNENAPSDHPPAIAECNLSLLNEIYYTTLTNSTLLENVLFAMMFGLVFVVLWFWM